MSLPKASFIVDDSKLLKARHSLLSPTDLQTYILNILSTYDSFLWMLRWRSSRAHPALIQPFSSSYKRRSTRKGLFEMYESSASYAECFAGCALTRHPGAQGHRSEVREARSATSFISHASSLNFLTGRLTQSILSRMHNTPDESSETVSTASP